MTLLLKDPSATLDYSELPTMSDEPSSFATVLVAASNEGKWKRLAVELRLGQEGLPTIALPRRAVLGMALNVLDNRAPAILDELSSMTVRLANSDQILLNADIDALTAGANLAISGDEIFQFGRAEQLGPGLYRLSKLLRGRRGTEWAAAGHSVGERFCLLDGQAGMPVELAPAAVGGMLAATAHGIGDSAPLPERQLLVSGEAMRPPTVCHLQLSVEGTALHASWVRRSHRSWAWIDAVGDSEDPYPDRYRVVLTGPGGELVTEISQPNVSFPLASLPAQTGETVTVTVHRLGSMAISHAKRETLII